MYLIDQDLANQIAVETKLQYEMMNEMFRAKEEDCEKMEMDLREKIFMETQSTTLARAIQIVLPLLLENRAITRFIQTTKQPQLRAMMPEILTAEDAVYLMIREIPTITRSEATKMRDILKVLQKNLPKNI